MTDPQHPPTLLLMAGMPGSGKSTLARALSVRLGWPCIDKDVLLTRVLPLPVDREAAQGAAYDLLFDLGLAVLDVARGSVILDSPAGEVRTVKRASALAEATGARLVIVLCLADREVRNARVASRTPTDAQPFGVSRTAGTGRERFGHLPVETLEVLTDEGESFDALVDGVIRALRLGGWRDVRGGRAVPPR